MGNIEKFNQHWEDWPQYVERLDFCLDANGITDICRKERCSYIHVQGAHITGETRRQELETVLR